MLGSLRKPPHHEVVDYSDFILIVNRVQLHPSILNIRGGLWPRPLSAGANSTVISLPMSTLDLPTDGQLNKESDNREEKKQVSKARRRECG